MSLFVAALSRHTFSGLRHLTMIYTIISCLWCNFHAILFLLKLCYVKISGVRPPSIIINLAAILQILAMPVCLLASHVSPTHAAAIQTNVSLGGRKVYSPNVSVLCSGMVYRSNVVAPHCYQRYCDASF